MLKRENLSSKENNSVSTIVVIAIETFKQVLGVKSLISEKLCNAIQNSNCDSVINSSKWEFFKKTSFSDISIVFFVIVGELRLINGIGVLDCAFSSRENGMINLKTLKTVGDSGRLQKIYKDKETDLYSILLTDEQSCSLKILTSDNRILLNREFNGEKYFFKKRDFRYYIGTDNLLMYMKLVQR